MDRTGADFFMVEEQVSSRLKANPVPYKSQLEQKKTSKVWSI